MIKAIVFDAEQAVDFVPPAGIAADKLQIVALAPSARFAFADRGLAAVASTEFYSDDDHREVAIEATRVRNIVAKAASEAAGEYASVTQRLIDVMSSVYLPAARLWKTLGDVGPWYCYRDGQWQLTQAKSEAFAALLRAVMPNGPVHVNTFGEYRGQWLVLLVQKLLLWRAQRWPRWMIANRGRMQFGLSRVIRTPGERLCVPTAPTSFKSDLASVARQLVSRELPEQLNVLTGWSDAVLDRQTDSVIESVLARVDNSVLHQALAVFNRAIRNQILGFARAERDMDPLVATLKPRIAASYQINNQLTSALWAACERRGIRRVVFHHNSLCDASSSAPAAAASMALTTERHYSRVPSDVYLVFSPIHQRCLEAYLPESRGKITAFRMKARPVSARPENQKLRVLFSDNYMEWRDHLPVIMQTSDELLESILDVCGIAERLDGIELVVRLKPKRELNSEIVRRATAKFHNAQISEYSVPFKKELERADVVIASMSSTIEEAFEYGSPVILYGRQERYSHLPDISSGAGGGLLLRAKSEGELEAILRDLASRNAPIAVEQRMPALMWGLDIPTVDRLPVLK